MLKHYQTHGLRLGTRGSLLLCGRPNMQQLTSSANLGLNVRLSKSLPMQTRTREFAEPAAQRRICKCNSKELSDGTIHAAVHSLKDLPVAESSSIAAHLPLAFRTDLLCTQPEFSLANLPHAAKVGTGSIRRKMQLLQKRPDLTVLDIRGNVGTRLKTVEDGLVDAVILAKQDLSGWVSCRKRHP